MKNDKSFYSLRLGALADETLNEMMHVVVEGLLQDLDPALTTLAGGGYGVGTAAMHTNTG
jgi:hypothetical protein